MTGLLRLEETAAQTTDRVWKQRVKAVEKEQSRRHKDRQPKEEGIFARDPLFGYSMEQAGEEIRRLSDKAEIRRLIDELT